MAPICCSKFVAQSTTARSVPGSGIDLTGSPMQTWPLPKRLDSPDLWTVPPVTAVVLEKAGRFRIEVCNAIEFAASHAANRHKVAIAAANVHRELLVQAVVIRDFDMPNIRQHA